MKFLGTELNLGPNDAILGDYVYDNYAVQGSTTAITAPGTEYRALTTPVLPAGVYEVSLVGGYASDRTKADLTTLLRWNNATVDSIVARVSTTGLQYTWPVTLRAHVVVATSGSTHTLSVNYYTTAGTMYFKKSSLIVRRVK